MGTYEKDLTLRTALILQNKLQKEGAHVILTRTHDEYRSTFTAHAAID